ncbi:thioesterase II family protein [Roseateles sp. BYS180W]|uniref:Thioesterase II family protein n=1 Tax=Roseateles rivi TaxID=3299028 RepID=A0ABW7FXP1_9BURK
MIDLLCLPCAGASATMYMRWRRLVPSWLSLVPIELPGRGARSDEAFATDFDALVGQISREIMGGRHRQGARPYALFGHSMGGLLSYGVAQRLRLLGAPLPRYLFVSGSPAPSRRDAKRFTDKVGDEALIADLRAHGGTPEEVFENPELLRITLDTLAADYRVCASYSHRALPPLPVPVHACGGRDDDISVDDLLAWGDATSAGFSLEWFTGGHFFIRQHERSLLQGVAAQLARTNETRLVHDAV